MVRHIKPTLYHRAICLYFGKKKQIAKVKEEVLELKDAVELGDRNKIIEELADVENTLPCLMIGIVKDKVIRIERMPDKPELASYTFLLIGAIQVWINDGNSVLTNTIIAIALTGYCNALHELYVKYDINQKEVDEIIDFKKKRTIKRIAGGYYK